MAAPSPKKKPGISTPKAGSFHNSFEWSTTRVWVMLACIAGLLFYWMSQSPRPYDDDNIGRFFMAQMAPEKPEFFVNTWGRPLAILLFVIPSQFGYWYCAGVTVLLSIGTAYLVYRTAVETGRPNAWLGVIFTAFQPIFFATGFSLCTEPIAAFFLAWGVYLFYKKNYVPSSLMLSLTPLARLEMVVLLPFFAITLFKEKKYVEILLMGFGLVIFQLGGMILTGDTWYLLTQAQGAGHGMYQNGPFDHYFKRFIFIVGPTLFVLVLLQLVHDLRERRLNVINASVVVMFSLHVYFYWKGNVAQIGFLRHLVAVAPMIALWGLDGFNRWFEDRAPDKAVKRETLINILVISGLAILSLSYYGFNLVGDYYLSEEKDYLKFLTVLLLLLLFALNKYLGLVDRSIKWVMIMSVAALTVVYAVAKERPLQLDPEHQVVRNFHDYYVEKIKPGNPRMMVVHTWFFFFEKYNLYKDRDSTSTFWEMKKENLDKLPVGGLVAWDSHYSWRLVSDVQQEDLVNNPGFKLHRQFVSPNRRFAILLFEKVQS